MASEIPGYERGLVKVKEESETAKELTRLVREWKLNMPSK